MAGNSNLTVSISADIVDLQTKVSLAASELKTVSSAVRSMAADMAKGSDAVKAQMLPAFQSLNAQLAEAKAAFASVDKDLRQKISSLSEEHKKFGGVIAQNRVAIAEFGHSIRSIGDGLASGIDPARLFGMEIFRVGQALTELNGVSLMQIAGWGGIVAGAVAAAGAIVALIGHVNRLRAEAALGVDLRAMGVNIATSDIHLMSDELRRAGYTIKEVASLTADERNSFIRSFSEIRFGSTQLTRALLEMVPAFASTFGVTASQAVERLKKDMEDLSGSGAKTMESLHLSTDELAHFQSVAAQNPKEGLIIYLDHLKHVLDEATNSAESAENQSRSLMGFLAEQGDSLRRALHGDFSNPTRQQRTELSNQASDQSVTTAENTLPDNIAPDMSAIEAQLKRMQQDTTKTHTEIAAEQAAYLKHILEADRIGLEARASLNNRYEDLIYQNKADASSEELELLRTNALKAATEAGADRAKELAAQRAVLTQGLNDEKLTADAKLELRKQLAQLDLRDTRASASEQKAAANEAWHAYVSGIEEQVEAAKGNFDQQIALVQQWVARAKQLYGQNSTNYNEANKKLAEIDNERAQALKRAAEQQADAVRNLAEAQANLAKIGEKSDVGEFKPSLALVLNSSGLQSQVAAQVAKLRDALDRDIAGLNEKIQVDIQVGDKEGATAAYKQLTADLLTFSQQAQQINEKAAQAVQSSWEKITQPIGNAFDKILGSALGANGKIGISVAKAAEGVVLDWAKAALKMVATWAAHEIMKTALTTTGVAARTAVNNTGELAQTSMLLTTLAKFLGIETTKTAAAVAGTGIRTAAQMSGATAGAAVDAAASQGVIQRDAAKAAAGTYAALADIPIIGPIIAPAAAAVAYGAVMAFESFDVGTPEVPRDMLAQVHQGEMIVPANQAGALRSMLGVSGSASFPTLNLPKAANSNLQGSSSQVSYSGDTAHTMNFTHSPTFNATGVGSADLATIFRRSNSDFKRMAYQTARDWQGKGANNRLPGR
jgi:hypothetical protein